MKKIMACAVLFVLLATGCAVHIHNVGDGAKGGDLAVQRQWYVLWGLVPINQVDSKVMAAGATDYTIRTEATALDVVISAFTGMVTVNCRSVTVTK